MMKIFRSSVLLGSLFSGCLAVSPGSVILTIDASSITEDDRAKLVEVGVFICDEGKGADCSQANSYDIFDTLLSEKGLKEKETLGLSLREFSGPLHVRLIAAEKNPSFTTPNDGLVAQAEAFVDVEARDDLLVPLGLLPDPQEIIELPVGAAADTSDLSVVGCGKGDPFLAMWSENVGTTTSLIGINIDANNDLQNEARIISNLPNNRIFDVELAGDANCDNVGIGLLTRDEANGLFIVQASPLVNQLAFEQYQLIAQAQNNLKLSFGAEGFGLTWSAQNPNGNAAQNFSFFQEAASGDLVAIGGTTNLRPLGGEFLGAVSNAGGADGVSVFLEDGDPAIDDPAVIISDSKTGNQAFVAVSEPGHFPFDPQVAFLDNARILVSWFDCEGLDCSILGRIVDRAGQDASNKFPSPIGGIEDLCEVEGCFLIADKQNNPFDLSLGVGPDGGFVVAWRFQKDSGVADVFELQISFYGTDGPRLNPFSRAADTAAPSEVQVNDDPQISQGNIQAAITPSGDVSISWVDTLAVSSAPIGFAAKVIVVPTGLKNLAATPK